MGHQAGNCLTTEVHGIIDEIWDLFHNISNIMSNYLLETFGFPESIASKYLASNIKIWF
jgi:hypothetical protein